MVLTQRDLKRELNTLCCSFKRVKNESIFNRNLESFVSLDFLLEKTWMQMFRISNKITQDNTHESKKANLHMLLQLH